MQEASWLIIFINMAENGKEVELAVDPRESLLDTLRNRLGLTSVKKGCEVGECGAWTVLVDGEAIDRPQRHDSGRVKRAKRRAEHHPEGIYRGSSRAVRVLYARADHVGCGDSRDRKAV